LFWNFGFFIKKSLEIIFKFWRFFFKKIIEFVTQNFQILVKCEKRKRKRKKKGETTTVPFGVFYFSKIP
jgi:hypothetical protein